MLRRSVKSESQDVVLAQSFSPITVIIILIELYLVEQPIVRLYEIDVDTELCDISDWIKKFLSRPAVTLVCWAL